MEKKPTLSFCLSQEEAFASLQYIYQPGLPGLDTDVLKELKDREKNLVFGVAERAMIARGFLIRDTDNNLKLSAPVFACLSACAESDKSLVIQYTIHDGYEEYYFFHAARKMRVIHTIPITTIHQFIAVEDDVALNRAIVSVLKLSKEDKINCPTVVIDLSILNKARDLALDGKIKETEKLINKSIKDETVSATLARSLSGPISNTTLIYSDGKEKTGFSIYQSKNGMWMLKPFDDDEKSEKIHVRPVDSNEVISEVTSWFRS